MMRFTSAKRLLPIICLLALLRTAQAFETPPAERFHPALSLQGFTGILNTPSAHVTEEGSFYGIYSNQKESKWRDSISFQDNYHFSIGLFSIAEIGGRVTEAPGIMRDLSGSAKLTTEPLTRNIPSIPVLAIGMQDFGGGAKSLQTKYVVLSKDLWRFRVSSGYGSGPDRMKGLFGGAEFKAHDWVYILGDYDTKETNVGARLVTPQFWKIPAQFTVTAKTSLDHKPGNFDIAFGFSVPLDFKMRNIARPRKLEQDDSFSPTPTIQNGEAVSTPSIEKSERSPAFPSLTKSDSGEFAIKNPSSVANTFKPAVSRPASIAKLAAFRDRLTTAGFMNVRIGEQDGSTLVLEYENVIFNHNEMDALGVVSGMAVEDFKGDYETLRVITKKKNIQMMQITMPFSDLARYLETGRGLANLKDSMAISSKIEDDARTNFIGGDTNSTFLTASLMLWPGLSTFVGTEVGVFDYQLSIKPDLTLNLWKGAIINARWDIPFLWSENLDISDSEFLARYNLGREGFKHTQAQMDRLMLFQGIKLLPDIMLQVGGGMYLHNLYGSLNELIWNPGEGAHRLRLVHFWGRNDNSSKDAETFLASYRYYFNPLDLFLEGTLGKFWSQDRGYALELKRMFGDTSASLYYKNSIASDNHHWQAVGIQFSFPLTPGKEMKSYYRMQVRGSDEWSYAQESVLAIGSQKTNDVNNHPPLAINPQPPTALYRIYFNRDRMNSEYLKSHLDRLRESWLRYKKI